jgi:magnesium chelatase subunit D
MKRALLFNAVNPRIGGVLIRGKKGTAKSTAVRSLATLLPEVSVVRGCPYSCDPGERQGLCQWCQPGDGQGHGVTRQVRIVDLPVGATEDRLVGSLDIEQAIKTGSRSFEPGLIATTHRGILYIDEVNLLNDHLVDVLLDASAMGRNYVEREGVSISHAAEFILVGTMNPEEGDLRPQLLDRFGLAVEVEGTFPAEDRREVVRRRIGYEADPYRFMAQWQEEEEAERARLYRTRQRLPQVTVGSDILDLITDICAEYQVDGLRGDIVMYKTASTIAAYEGRTEVTAEDVREAAHLALLHRQRRQPFQQPHLATEQLDSMVQDFQNQQNQRDPSGQDSEGPDESDDGEPDESELDPETSATGEDNPGPFGGRDQDFDIGNSFPILSIDVEPPDNRPRRSNGRRSKAVGGPSAGRYVGARAPTGDITDLALDATLRVAAPYQGARRRASDGRGPALKIEPWDVREKVRETKVGNLILFVVDASGSMAAQQRMVAVKGAVHSLLLDAYQRRDRVGMISFRGASAELLLPPTNSVELAQTHLSEMPTGGRTPLSQGLYLALQVIETERLKDREVIPLVVLLSDGRANVPLGGAANSPEPSTGSAVGPYTGSPYTGSEERGASYDARTVASLFAEHHIASVVIDTEVGVVKLGLARPIADAMGAQYIRLDELRAENLANAVRVRLPSGNLYH